MNKTERGEPDRCIVCGCSSSQTLYASTFTGSVEEAADYFLAHRRATARGQIVKCASCGFVFTSPRFSSESYDRIYAAVGKSIAHDTAFTAASDARFERLAGIVRRFQRTDASFLDFGCGDGGFLRHVSAPTGKGFETGPVGVRRAGPSEIVTGQWASLAGSPTFPEGAFDHVVAFDVLEHLPQIEQDLDLIRLVLKPRGFLFASVPNIKSIVAQVMRGGWNMLLLEHLWYFSPETFQRFMEKRGFGLVATKPVPYDAPLAHIATRLAQTFGLRGALPPRGLSRVVLPVPAGIMLGIFQRAD